MNEPDSVAVDGSGNVYIGDRNNNAIKKWTAATGAVTTLVGSGLLGPQGVAVDTLGNVYLSDTDHNLVAESPRAFVAQAPKNEPATAGTDALSAVLPTGENLLPPFVPSSDQAWLTIGTITGGVVNFNFALNANASSRVGHITVLGVQTTVTQAADTAASIAVSSGSPQSTTVNTAFPAPLKAIVKDAASNPISGVTVTFTAPGGGASGTFAGGANTAVTDAAGIATSATFTANANAGGFNVSAAAPGAGSVNFVLTTNAAVTVAPASLPDWTVNKAGYTQTITNTGGTGASTFAVTVGAVPIGMTLTAGGVLNGTPTVANTFNFTVTATDTVGATGAQAYTVVINAAVVITTASLPNWTVNKTGYTQTITNTGGTGASTFAVTVGAVPTGMTLSAGGVLSGTPTVANTFNFTVTATDTVGATGAQAYTVVINPAVVITTASLPNWTVNKTGYTQTITNTGGTGASTFAVTVGAVPTGMTLTAGGVLSGTPTVANTFNFTITATDTVGATGAQAYTVVINPAVVITTASLPNWTVNKTGYTQTITNTGGTGASTFAVTVGAVPTGLTLTAGGVLSGTPTVANTFNFTITATDTVGATGTQAYAVIINPAVTVSPATLPNWAANKTGYSQTVTSANGTGARTLSISAGAIPTGMTFTAATGVLDGTPTTPGTFNFTVTATDTVGATGAQAYTVIIHPPVTYTVTTTVNSIVVTDIGDNTDTLAVSELGAGNIQFDVAGRTFSINNGAPILGSSGVIPLTGVTAITINAAGGDDTINVGAFTVLMPSLTINGGTGNDTVNLNGDITFAANANLDLDLQNDTATPGTDSVNVAAGTNILTSGTGTITVKVSRNIALAAGSSFETVNGGITLEANQQAVTTAGSFIGVDINGAIVRSTGTGLVSVIGKGGNSGTDQAGVYVHAAGLISGGTTGTTIVTGFGGLASSGGVAQDAGVIVNGANTTITSAGSAVSVTGTGGGAGGATDNYGVSVDSGAQITAGGSGTVTVLGNGGNLTGTGGNNVGVAVYTSGAKITSGGGNVSVTGTGGGAGAATINIGVFLATTGQIAAGGTGTVTVIGNGGNANGAGGSNSGVQVISAGSAITSNGGDVSVTGTGGCLNGTGTANSGVFLNFSAAVTANGGNISLTGTGGGGAGSDTNHGLQLQSSSTVAATGNGSVTFTGTGGGGTGSSHGIRIVQTASVTAVNGNIAMTGSITDGTTASQGFSLSNAVAVGAKVQTTGSGTITVAADSMAISTSGVTMDAGTHSVTLRQKTFGQLINVGSTVDTTPNTLELSDGELDVITASTLKIGDAQSGPITVSAVISPANYKTLALARDTTFLGTGGFASDIGPLATDIENITVTGTLTINSGATLAMTPKGGFVPVNVQSFQIITNDGTDAVTGNFNGLPEQQAIPGFLGSGVNALITYVGGTGNDVVILTNRPPVAGVVSVERYPTQSVKIPVATILAQTSDPDPGDIVSFVSVGTPTAPAHGTLLVSGGFVFYTPLKPGGVVDQNADTFSYKVTDNHGAQSTGSVVVGIKVDNAPSLNITGLTLQPGGGVAVDFSGIPNRTYGLQFKVALADPAWTNIGPVTADQYGVGHYVDGPPPHASSSGFYRLVYPAP